MAVEKQVERARAVWSKPQVQRLRAGDAEQFTRPGTLDGGFTKS